ncbi:MAG: Lrp/AsnC family transcriptional regulator [Pyrinomonadaceae bacterium]
MIIDDKDLTILRDSAGGRPRFQCRFGKISGSDAVGDARKSQEAGGASLIKGYAALLNAEALHLDLLAYIFVRVDDRGLQDDTEEEAASGLAALPSVLELHHLAGEDCFLVKCRARDTNDLYRILRDDFGRFFSYSLNANDDCVKNHEGDFASAGEAKHARGLKL